MIDNDLDGGDGREHTLLTPSIRDWLDGEPHSSGESLNVQKVEWRKRIRNGLLDIDYLADPGKLSDGELQQLRQVKEGGEVQRDLFARMTGSEVVKGSVGPEDYEPVLDPRIENSLVDMVAFIFRVKPTPRYFEGLLRQGLERWAELNDIHGFAVDEITVSTTTQQALAEEADDLIDAEVPLTSEQLGAAIEQEIRPVQEVVEHVQEHGVHR